MKKRSFSVDKVVRSAKSLFQIFALINIAAIARIISFVTGRQNVEMRAIHFLNSFFEKPVLRGRKGPDDYFLWQFSQGGRIYNYIREPNFTLKDKNILDLACGRGGKTVFYKSEGANRVVGIDLRLETVKMGTEFVRKYYPENNVDFVRGNAALLPFRNDTFDHIIMNDMVEHISEKDLEFILKEANRVLNDSGSLLVDFSPYFNPRGSHLYDYVYTPYCHLLFSKKSLIQYCQDKASSFEIRQFSELNKISAERFRRIVLRAGLRVKQYSIYRDKHYFARIPILKNLFINKVFCILGKSNGM